MLASEPLNIVVTGASSGLGSLIADQLSSHGHDVVDWSLETGVDISKLSSIIEAIAKVDRRIDCLINCAGVNEIDYLPLTTIEDWDRVMNTNARGIFLATRALISYGHLTNGTILNIISNASHIPMTASIAYNASKGAAHIMTLQMARELKKTHGVTVFGISPNKLSGTGMSDYIDKRVCEVRGWTPEKAKEYQLAALPAGEETDPMALAEFVGFLLWSKARHKYLNGCILPYGA